MFKHVSKVNRNGKYQYLPGMHEKILDVWLGVDTGQPIELTGHPVREVQGLVAVIQYSQVARRFCMASARGYL